MKTLLPFLLIIFHSQCYTYTKKEATDCLSVVFDRSDTHQLVRQIVSNHIVSFLRVDTTDANYLFGANVMFTSISDFRFGKKSTVRLNSVSLAESNINDRRKEINGFHSKLKQALKEYSITVPPTSQSFVFYTLMRSLDELASCKECYTRKMVLISDAHDNTDTFSVFNNQHIALMQNNPDSLERKLDVLYPVEHSLQGIELIICHIPRSQDEDYRFQIITDFLKRYLSKKGITVVITTGIEA